MFWYFSSGSFSGFCKISLLKFFLKSTQNIFVGFIPWFSNLTGYSGKTQPTPASCLILSVSNFERYWLLFYVVSSIMAWADKSDDSIFSWDWTTFITKWSMLRESSSSLCWSFEVLLRHEFIPISCKSAFTESRFDFKSLGSDILCNKSIQNFG